MTPERIQRLQKVIDRRQPGLAIVLENVHDPHNISAVMRSCDAVGIQDVYILTTEIPRHKKWGFKSSSSASKWLTIHTFDDLDKCIAALRANFPCLLAASLAKDNRNLYELDLTQNMALIFGNEKDGVSNAMLRQVDGCFIIPQMGIIQSLNISVACAVSLYEAYRQRAVANMYATPQMSPTQRSTLLEQWGINAGNESA